MNDSANIRWVIVPNNTEEREEWHLYSDDVAKIYTKNGCQVCDATGWIGAIESASASCIIIFEPSPIESSARAAAYNALAQRLGQHARYFHHFSLGNLGDKNLQYWHSAFKIKFGTEHNSVYPITGQDHSELYPWCQGVYAARTAMSDGEAVFDDMVLSLGSAWTLAKLYYDIEEAYHWLREAFPIWLDIKNLNRENQTTVRNALMDICSCDEVALARFGDQPVSFFLEEFEKCSTMISATMSSNGINVNGANVAAGR